MHFVSDFEVKVSSWSRCLETRILEGSVGGTYVLSCIFGRAEEFFSF